jgi:hypothetical protein
MNELNALEIKLLNGLFEKHPSLKSHIDYIKVSKRKNTSLGLIVSFEYEESDIEFSEINALFSNGEIIEIKKLKKGLSYVIDVTAGRIEYLEFSTFEENWDGIFGEYMINDKIDYEKQYSV